jgi:hypothetical protein
VFPTCVDLAGTTVSDDGVVEPAGDVEPADAA